MGTTMEIDVIYVTYNSEKWIRPCFSSWEKEAAKSSVNVFIADNGSTDRTLRVLEELKQEIGTSFAGFHIVSEKKNYGFGLANNIAASYGISDYICFLNIDTEIQEGMLEQLFQYINQSPPEVGIWELRQFPFEHPKYYDPVTLETSWCSGAAFAIRRKVFEEIGGFDPHFFMYAEDVDLSWKAQAAGYKILYCPKVLIKHNSYCKPGEIKSLQYGYSMRNNLLMRRRYGTMRDLLDGWILVLKLLLTNRMGWSFNRDFLKIVCGYFKERKYFPSANNRQSKIFFHGLDYSKMRYGAFQETGLIKSENIQIWTFILNKHSETISAVKQCLMNETVPSKRIDVIEYLSEAAERLDGDTVPDNVWINVICGEKRVFADHNEILADMVYAGSSVVGTVDENGQSGQSLSYYLFNLEFYKNNRQCFLQNKDALLVENCSRYSKLREKQTVV